MTVFRWHKIEFDLCGEYAAYERGHDTLGAQQNSNSSGYDINSLMQKSVPNVL